MVQEESQPDSPTATVRTQMPKNKLQDLLQAAAAQEELDQVLGRELWYELTRRGYGPSSRTEEKSPSIQTVDNVATWIEDGAGVGLPPELARSLAFHLDLLSDHIEMQTKAMKLTRGGK